jgi:hypothetical protein
MSNITLNPATLPGVTTTAFGLQCVSGFVNLFRFIVAPPPGSIIGTITPLFGQPISLIQTQPTPPGGIPLSSVDGQFATLCGVFTRRMNQTVLDVRLVNPSTPVPTPTPTPFPNQLLLLLLLLLLLQGQGGILGTTGGLTGLSGLGSLLGGQNLGALSSLLGGGQNLGALSGLLGGGQNLSSLAAVLQSTTGQSSI